MKDFIHALDPAQWVQDTHGHVLDDWQARVARSGAKRLLLCCSRQAGKSFTVAVLAAHRAIYRPKSLILCVAPSQRQSAELFRKVNELLPPSERSQDSQSTIELANGSRILSLPGSPDTLRGFSAVDLLLADEAAFAEDDLFTAVSPMLAVSGGRLIALSSPNGKRGWFYDQWQSGGTTYEREAVTVHQCKRISVEFIESERASMSAQRFQAEYECQFGEAEHSAFSNIDSIFSDDVEVL